MSKEGRQGWHPLGWVSHPGAHPAWSASQRERQTGSTSGPELVLVLLGPDVTGTATTAGGGTSGESTGDDVRRGSRRRSPEGNTNAGSVSPLTTSAMRRCAYSTRSRVCP